MADFPLASVDEMITRTNAIDAGEIRPLFYQSLKSATIQLRSILRLGNLDRTVGVVEEFWVDRDSAVRLQTNRFLPFRLANGFVNDDTNPVLLRYGISKDQLDAAADLDAQFVRVEKERGVVNFDNYGFQDSFISVYRRHIPSFYYNYLFRITYDHGFETKGTAEGKIYKGVPEWLSEMAVIKAREIYQLTNPATDVPADQFSGNLTYLVEDKMRWNPLAIDPF